MLKFKQQGSRVGRGKKAKGASEEVGGGEEESLQASRGAAGGARSVAQALPPMQSQVLNCRKTNNGNTEKNIHGSNSYM